MKPKERVDQKSKSEVPGNWMYELYETKCEFLENVHLISRRAIQKAKKERSGGGLNMNFKVLRHRTIQVKT